MKTKNSASGPATILWAAPSILISALLIAWASESAQFFIAQGFALPILAYILLLGGWFLERSYLSHRYDGDGFRSAGLDEVFRWASEQHDQRIGTTIPVQYPLSGSDLSNRVSFVGRQRSDAGFTAAKGCRQLRSAVQAGHFRYVLTAGGTEPWDDGDSHCLAADPAARPDDGSWNVPCAVRPM